jgi:threonine dehydrogenase-like Zn-dependent dehydrogenase
MAEVSSNSAAVLYGVKDLRVHDWKLPEELEAGHVRVQMSNVGICGSDVHYLQHGRWDRHLQNHANDQSQRSAASGVAAISQWQ